MILKQSAIRIAQAFTRWNLWQGGGSSEWELLTTTMSPSGFVFPAGYKEYYICVVELSIHLTFTGHYFRENFGSGSGVITLTGLYNTSSDNWSSWINYNNYTIVNVQCRNAGAVRSYTLKVYGRK